MTGKAGAYQRKSPEETGKGKETKDLSDDELALIFAAVLSGLVFLSIAVVLFAWFISSVQEDILFKAGKRG